MDGVHPFSTKGYLKNYLEERQTKIKEEINSFKEDYILNASEENLAKSLAKKYTLRSPTLKSKSNVEYLENKSLTVTIPFEGDEELFYYQPPRFSLLLESKIYIRKSKLHLEYPPHYSYSNYDPNSLRSRIEYEIEQIKTYLNHIKNEVDNFNNSLENHIISLIKTRKG